MKNKKRNLVFLLPLVTVTFQPLLFSSCSDKTKQDITINKTITTTDYNFFIPFTLVNKKCKTVHFEVSGATQDLIELESATGQIEEGVGQIKFKIDSSVKVSKTFRFNISITCYEKEDTKPIETFNLSDIFVLFVYSPSAPQEDKPYLLTKRVENTNNHDFLYRVIFPIAPDPTHIEAELGIEEVQFPSYLNNPFYLKQDKAKILFDETTNNYYIDVFTHANLGILRTTPFVFNLTVSFWNSYGLKQDVKFENIAALFLRDEEDKTIPDDFFVIEQQGSKNILSGLQPEITNAQNIGGGFFEILKIPATVTDISSDAFSFEEQGKSWFINVNKIIFNHSLHSIGENAFSKFKNLFEVDLTVYTDISTIEEIPEWMQNDDIIFANQSIPTGYIWTDVEEVIALKIRDRLGAKGLPKLWSNFDIDLITPVDIYNYNKEQKVVVGIHPKYVTELWKYKIIKFPNNTKIINDAAIQIMGLNPYINKIGQCETRRIIFPNNVSEIGWMQRCGISGPIHFPGQINTIKSSCFQQVNSYDSSISSLIVKEELTINFNQAQNLTKIENNAFAGTKLKGNIVIPQNVKTIGNNAFFDHRATAIILKSKVDSIGNLAFASSSNVGTLNHIDLLVYGDINLDPSHPVEGQPNWIFQNENIFKLSCANDGKVLICIENLEEEKKEQVCDWFHDQQQIPANWTIDNN